MKKVVIKNVTVEYKTAKQSIIALDNLFLEVEQNDFMVIVGPSGCGKTTILKLLSGLVDYQGEILIDGIDENQLSFKERNIAYLSQEYVLYPHLTVFDNIAFPLKMQKIPLAEVKSRVGEVAEILDIELMLSRKPKHLSGGQQQRVAIARAMIKQPNLYLFDEPFSNLDPKIRTELRHLIYKLHKQINSTFIFVTHDQQEAMMLATKLVVMNHGRIEQIASPIEVYNHPINDFVYEFMHSGDDHD